MLQTGFRPSCMNRASVFEWHKRFKEGGESVRDDERCGRSKEVRTPELIGQIKNLLDKDRRVSIETIDVSVGTVHTIICEELKKRKICTNFLPRVLREDRKKDVVMTAGRWSSWSIQIPQFLILWWPAMKAGSTAMTQRPRDRVPSGSMLALPDPRRGCPRGVMGKAMDCGIVVREFVLQSRYYVHSRANTLGKGMNPLILPAMGSIVPPLFL